MLSFSLYLTEDIVTRREIGQGLGGYLGRPIGGIIGGLSGLGLGLGLNMIDPKITDGGNPHILGTIAGLGAVLGTGLGGQLGKKIGGSSISNPDDPADFNKASHRIGYLAKPATSGYGLTSDLLLGSRYTNNGTNFYNAVSKNAGADKIGYGNTGKVGTFLFGPLSGLFRPKNVRNNI